MRMKRMCFAVLLLFVLGIHSQVKPVDEFQIKYHLNGGSWPDGSSISYEAEELPVELEAPVREGYNFAGWFTDRRYHHKITEIDANRPGIYNLYAKWTECIDGDFSIQMYSYKDTTAGYSDKQLKNCTYNFLQEVEIPGMPSTKEADFKANRITNTSQCPQGICITEEYLLVSSYSSGEGNNLGGIHVFCRDTGDYLVTLGMKEESHLGGITYDGASIWVCHSDNNTLERIPYQFVEQLASDKPKSVIDCSGLFREYHISNTPSCITYYDGMIWVATYTQKLDSTMIAYEVTEEGLQKVESYRIPAKVQGITFDEEGRAYISASYGRKNSSYLMVYESAERLDSNPNEPVIKIEMPPCSEEIDIAKEQIYVVFESAGEKYFEGTDGKGTSISPIDKVLILAKSSIFQ